MGTDGTARYQVGTLSKVFTNENVGFERFTFNPNPQPGWLPMFGGAYSRTTYADLWAWVQTQDGYCISEIEWQEKFAANNGNVPFYSSGDGSSTFRVPSVSCWIKGASGISEVGSYLEAGLPNIDGNIYAGSGSGNTTAGAIRNATGAFYSGNTAYEMPEFTTAKWAETDNGTERAYFDASRSSAIYGKSTTVQPQSIVGMWMVKAYGTVSNSGSVDVANLAAEVSAMQTSKANKDKLSMPSDTAITVSANWNSDGFTYYTAPADGWGGMEVTVTAETRVAVLVYKTYGNTIVAPANKQCGILTPFRKGEQVAFYVQTPANISSISMKFFYAQSEVSA